MEWRKRVSEVVQIRRLIIAVRAWIRTSSKDVVAYRPMFLAVLLFGSAPCDGDHLSRVAGDILVRRMKYALAV